MLNFTIFGIPVKIHWMFWLLAFFLAGGAGDPKYLILWAGVLFISILWHELGHAFAYRKYGATPSIQLYGMGGVCYGHGYQRTKNWRLQQVIISLAGPAFGFILFLLVWILRHFFGDTYISGYYKEALVRQLLWVNGFWTLMNLLPIYPLDGGQALHGLLGSGKNKMMFLNGLGLLIATAVGIIGLTKGYHFMAILFGYMAFENFQRLRGKQAGGLF